MQDVIIGTAGHIDHGKTTLLKALTGIDTDRLAEEKRRGISIDIGFAHMQLGPRRVGFIDVPGHEKFVKNMLAGIGGIQMVLMVVAADESVMPQTVEHFEICKLLEIPTGVVALTKKTLVEKELLSLVELEVRELLRGSLLEGAPVIAVDSVSGEGIEELKDILSEQIRKSEQHAAPSQDDHHVFRLPIDRVFSIRGFGTVVTGTPWGSTLRQGEMVTVHPSAKTAKVRGIEIFNQKSDSAKSQQRTALNLSGVQTEELRRGMVVSHTNTLVPSHTIDAMVQLLSSAPQVFKAGSIIRLHHCTEELIGRIFPLEGAALRPGCSMLAQLRLEGRVVCCPKDHFILRRYSPLRTIGGGVVLDSSPRRHRKKDLVEITPELKKLWSIWEAKDPMVDPAFLEYYVKLQGTSGMTLPQLVARTGFLPEYLLTLLKGADSIVLIPQEPLLSVFKPALEKLKEQLMELLSDFHARHTLAAGLQREELKERLMSKAPSAYFQYLLDLLQNEKKIQVNASIVSLSGKEVTLTAEQQKIRKSILELIADRELKTPSLSELIRQLPFDSDQIQQMFHFLIHCGELIRVNEDLVVAQAQIKALQRRLKELFPPGQSFTVGQFKEAFKISRKYAIPLLEYLDRQRVTQRIQDRRLVR